MKYRLIWIYNAHLFNISTKELNDAIEEFEKWIEEYLNKLKLLIHNYPKLEYLLRKIICA